MLYGLIQGAKQFQRKDLSVGDIRTKNILITNNQELKMVNTITSPDEKPAIDKIIDQFDNTTMFFLGTWTFMQPLKRQSLLVTMDPQKKKYPTLKPKPGRWVFAFWRQLLSKTQKVSMEPVEKLKMICWLIVKNKLRESIIIFTLSWSRY